MAMLSRASGFSSGPRLEPQLRLAKGLAREQRQSATTFRKIGLAAAGLLLGAALILVVLAQGKAAETDPDQAWFWKPKWLAGELEADQEIATGQGIHYASDEAFLASLETRLEE
jgi:hypothetical protein